MELEKEFEIMKAKHKLRVLQMKMLKYFEALNCENPEKDAKIAVKDLVLNADIKKFNSLYEKAYAETSGKEA